MKLIGIVLIVLGVIGLLAGGISWTQREKVVDLGPVEVTRENRESIPLPPVIGGVLLVAGVVLLVAGGRRTAVVKTSGFFLLALRAKKKPEVSGHASSVSVTRRSGASAALSRGRCPSGRVRINVAPWP